MSVGMVLGGAGTKAYVHLGALKALREAGVTLDMYSGASSGSIVGAFMAAGRGIEETFETLKTYKFFDFATVNMPMRGLFNLDNLERNLMKQLRVRTFEDLKLPLYASATNLYTGKVEYICSGPLVPAIKASCAIPFVFSPAHLNGSLYVDGGLMDNLPYAPLLGLCDRIVVSSVSHAREIKKVENVVELTVRVLELIMNQDGENARRNSDLYIEPADAVPYGMLDTGHGDELFQLGYENAKKVLAGK